MQDYLNKKTPIVGDAWRADEVYTRIRGEMKYVFSLMDSETRFWINFGRLSLPTFGTIVVCSP